ncbi:MAG: glutamate-1-semialdehyde-2,1-aminomutase [Desulfobacteraceae bacterium]|nr:glutamate-1-semialdehyde-2,1-aminomutase [Desulfobacteraceae bacterium]
MKRDNSQKLFRKAINLIPGGVNSPVRACKSVGSDPLFIDHAEGSKIYDADGNEFIDYVGSWGPMILGHGNPGVKKAVSEALEKGSSFGAPTELEINLAEMILDAVESMEMVRMVNSGTEATMSAIRLARGVTGRDAIIKFDGCYHGHADSLLVAAGSGVATLAIPGSPGVPADFIQHTLSLPYNDSASFKKVMAEQGRRIACVIVEPVAGNMGMVAPVPGFLQTLREETEKVGSLLIFDEVMTGFRVAFGGAQALYGIDPDITCLAKVIGGGLPVGAYGGKKEILSHIAPQGPVYQAGTLSGNPLAMAAGIATLTQLKARGFYDILEQKSLRLENGLRDAVARASIKAFIARVGSMIGLFFTDQTVNNFEDAKTSNLDHFTWFYKSMLEQGIYLAPSQFETWFVSMAHSDEDIDQTVEAAYNVFKSIKEGVHL